MVTLQTRIAGAVIGAGLFAGFAAAVAKAQPANGDPSPPPTYDFVQQAGEMQFAEGTLTLSGVAAGVLFFSDRPYRVGGQISNADFAAFWDKEDGFKGDPPNAVVSILGETDKAPALVELNSAQSDGTSMRYGVTVLRGELPESAAGVALFVDRSARPYRHGRAGAAPGAVGFEPYGPYCYHAPQDPRCRAWHHPYHPYYPPYYPVHPPYGPYGPYYHPGAYAAGVATGAAIANAANRPPYYYYPIPTGPLPPNCWINSQHTQMVCTVPLQ